MAVINSKRGGFTKPVLSFDKILGTSIIGSIFLKLLTKKFNNQSTQGE
jgi:hypothetical protein